MEIENKFRQRVDLQETRRQQLHYKELKKQAEMEEEEEFRKQVNIDTHYLFCSLPFPVPFPSIPFPSLPFHSIPFPSLPFPSLPSYSSYFLSDVSEIRGR